MQAPGPSLTPRQIEILNLVAKGLSNPDIGRLLDISVNTVKIHVAAVLRELGAANRTEAAAAFQKLRVEESDTGRHAQLAEQIGRPRIAVVRFADLSDDRSTKHFSAGLMEELITALSAWRWFPVISRGSSARFSSEDLDLLAVGESLNAKYLVTGTVRRGPSRIRVTAHLLDAEAGEEVWVESFQAELADLLVAQAELARQMVAKLAPSLLRSEAIQTQRRPLSEYSVWDLTCRGMWLKNHGTGEAVSEALEHFDRAITIDPDFTMAYYGRARTHHSAMYDQWTDDHARSLAAMRDDVAQCLRLEPDNPFSQYIAGLLNVVLGERDTTTSHLERAVSLNPSFASAISLLGQMHGMAGRLDECIALLEEALLLNPHGRVSWSYRGAIGTAHYVADRFEESIDWLKQALSARPDSPAELLSLAAAYVENGQPKEARATIDYLRRKRPEFSFKEHMKVFADVSEPQLVQKQIDALARIGYRLE